MLEVIRHILEETIFFNQDELGFVCKAQLESEPSREKKDVGDFHIPHELFPDSCTVQELASDESFLDEIQSLIAQKEPKELFLIPPFMGPKKLSRQLQKEFPQSDLALIALQKTISTLSQGTMLGVLMPEMFCSTRRHLSTREYIFQNSNLLYFICLDNSYNLFSGLHFLAKFNILILEVGKSNQIPTKFFRLPSVNEISESAEISTDFKRLVKQGGGRTNFGYVHREVLEPMEGLSFERYDPESLQRLDDMKKEVEKYGVTKKLGDICEIYLGTFSKRNDIKKLDGEIPSNGIPLIGGRDIRSDGSLDFETVHFKIEDKQDRYLESGDICLSMINSKDQLRFSEITSNMPKLAASPVSVLVLKLKPNISSDDRDLILAYLRSPIAIEWLSRLSSFLGEHIRLSPASLKELPVPMFDEDFQNAVRSLNEAAKQFGEWKKSAEEARNSLFEFNVDQDSRLYLLSTGREARQRQEAAKLIDDFDYRARTRLPHPIAYRWRTVKSSYPDLEGYMGVLECAEVAICYLAHVAIVLAQHLDIPINHLKQDMAERLSEKQHGTNFGDWVTILRQVRDSKQFRALTGHIPFYEVLKFLEPQADEALQQLSKCRNDQAHNRGPKGAQVTQAYNEALEALEVLLKSAEFVSEYPLRYIEDTKRDSIKKVTNYSYRDLMGDHPLVPIKIAQTADSELEASSLYLVDRDGKLFLLRPLLSRRQCPECGTWATFYLDSYKKSGDSVLLKSMEHGHIALDPSVAPIFRDWGVLKENF